MDLVIVNRKFKGKEQNAICHLSFHHQTSDWELKKPWIIQSSDPAFIYTSGLYTMVVFQLQKQR